MNLLSFILVLVGVMLNAAAQLFLKAGTASFGDLLVNGDSFPHLFIRVIANPLILCGLACYVISVGIWIIALSRVEVSIAYPMLSMGYVVNSVAASYLFGEVLSMQRFSGIGLIIAGVVLVARS